MPNGLVLDASVVAKWFNKGESNEEDALTLRSAWIDGNIEQFSPTLVIYEVCNSIWKNPNIDREQASSLAKLAARLAPNLIEIGYDESSESMNLARKSKLTYCDAVYIILSRYRKYPLVSADGDQLKVGKDYTTSTHISKVKGILES